jgi:hypothetical protein
LGGPTDAEESIRTAVGRCLDLLEPLDVQSIAFPALGTGAARYSVEKTASLMAVEIIDRLESSTHVIDASLWLHARSGMSELDFVAFYEEFARSQPRLTESKLIETRIEVNHLGVEAHDSELARLERERQELERSLVEARKSSRSGSVESTLSVKLAENQAQRAERLAGPQETEPKPIKLFISYAQEDRYYRDELIKRLKPLQKEHVLDSWTDREIHPGDDWHSKISDAIEEAQIFIFLISPDFDASEYIESVELSRAMERHRDGSARVVPVIVEPVFWRKHPLTRYQALPGGARAIAEYSKPGEAFVEVVQGIYDLIETLQPFSTSARPES